MNETPEARHWLYVAIRANSKVNAVRDLHRQGMDGGGVATGICKECGKPSPCPTAQAVVREPDGPCNCGPDCPKNAAVPEHARRYRYVAAVRRWWDADDGGAEEIAAAVIDVADGESAALRLEVARLNRRIHELADRIDPVKEA